VQFLELDVPKSLQVMQAETQIHQAQLYRYTLPRPLSFVLKPT